MQTCSGYICHCDRHSYFLRAVGNLILVGKQNLTCSHLTEIPAGEETGKSTFQIISQSVTERQAW